MPYISDIHTISKHKQSLHQIILKAFIEGQELSVVSALRQFQTIELRKIVSDLRREGIPISDRWETTPGKKRYKVYFLEASMNTDEIKEGCRDFIKVKRNL